MARLAWSGWSCPPVGAQSRYQSHLTHHQPFPPAPVLVIPPCVPLKVIRRNWGLKVTPELVGPPTITSSLGFHPPPHQNGKSSGYKCIRPLSPHRVSRV